MLSTLSVVNTNDAGPGSLRQAILDANTSAGADTIEFNISAGDPNFVDVDSALPGGDAAADAFVITPLSILPTLSDASGGTTIDARTQTAFTGDTNPFGPEIVLDGSLLGDVTNGLHLTSDNNQVHGLNIQGFASETDEIITQAGILIDGDGSLVTGNFIGTSATGTEAKANRGGVLIRNSANNTIGGSSPEARNVISSNTVMGIQLQGTSNDNTIQGNYIGTDALGLAPLGNGNRGIDVLVHSSGNLIGTDGDGQGDEFEGNLISGNTGYGIELRGNNLGTPTDNIIAGNWIGVDATGNTGLGNSGGIRVWGGAGTRIGTNADGISDVIERNVIADNSDWEGSSGNGGWGVYLTESSDTVIAGNYIGTGVDGLTPLGNTRDGIGAVDSPRTVIGGSVAAERNIIVDNGRYGIVFTRSSDGMIAGNFIGVGADGTTPLGNVQFGVLINDGANNIIGTDGDGQGDILERNVVSANGGDGIALRFLNDASPVDNTIAGNFIGVGADGTTPLGNAQNGVFLKNAANNTIGGDTPAERNVISGNGGTGVHIQLGSNNAVLGNYVGTTADGENPLGNAGKGILFQQTVGGTIEGNVVSANGPYGILFLGATGNTVLDNHIGTNATGDAALPNFIGLSIQDAGNNRVERNIISGNSERGVYLSGPTSPGNTFVGNYLGAGADGTTPVPNGTGMLIFGAPDNIIGTTAPGEGNLIAFNNGAGIEVMLDGATGNAIRGNSIRDNGGLGIDLSRDGVTLNDVGDIDMGPNNLQNFPVISQADSGASTRVVGSFNGAASATLTLDFYANSAADPSGYGEGQRWLGSAVVVTDAAGNADFNVLLAATTVSGEVITATATAADGSTSEFSGDDVVARPPVQIDIKPGSDDNPVNLVENGVIAVAIFTTDDFNANTVDASTVNFAGAWAVHWAMEDVDGDGDLDMIMHFRVQDTVLDEVYAQLIEEDLDADDILDSNHQEYELTLTGQTLDDQLFQGNDVMDLFLAGKNLRELLEDLADEQLI